MLFRSLLFKKTVRDHQGETQSWGNFLGEKFEAQDYWDPQKNTEGKFAYQALKGTYTWNKNRELWEKTANNENITFIFPATKEATTNNGRLVIDKYEDTETTYRDDKVYLPTATHLYALSYLQPLYFQNIALNLLFTLYTFSVDRKSVV